MLPGKPTHWEVIVIGAGASGLFSALMAGRRGRRVLLLDHARHPGEKIRISGGGKCNFTNLRARPEHYLSDNPAFCISPLHQFTPDDFVRLVESHQIPYFEKADGQLFCRDSARRIVSMLLAECQSAGVTTLMGTPVATVEAIATGFLVTTPVQRHTSTALVVATGGLSLPKMGATDLGYRLARQFGLSVIPPRPGLVPLLLDRPTANAFPDLAGLSLDAAVTCGRVRFTGSLLFTHHGLSGPVILQISSYWHPKTTLTIDLLPGHDAMAMLVQAREAHPRQEAATVLSRWLPRRLAELLAQQATCHGRLADLSNERLRALADRIQHWRLIPKGWEGFRTAEVTVGGVNTRELSSKTMMALHHPGLFFTGEVVDVTGQLGGFNLQWAWSSGAAAGLAV